MLQMIVGHWPARALHVAVSLGIPEAMGDTPRPVEDIAAATATHAPSLARLLRVLAMIGVTQGDLVRGYALTRLGATLRADAPDSVRDAALLMGSDVHVAAWGALAHSIRTGEAALSVTAGATIFDWLAAHPAERTVYDAWMRVSTHMNLRAVREVLQIADARCVVDVGGGSGALLAGMLAEVPAAHGILVDNSEDVTLDPAFVTLCETGRAHRLRLDVFTDAAPAGDLYLLKYFLHALDDAHAITVLRRCREAMRDDGRIAIIEMLVPDDGTPHRATLMDLNMLVLTAGGRERTADEYRQLCDAAGLAVSRVTATDSPLSVIEARRAD